MASSKTIYGKVGELLVFALLATFFLLLISFSTSPLYADEGVDSVVYKTVGLGVLRGKIPYVDLFDNKGPVLYWINALGQFLTSGNLGLFVLQVVALTFSLHCMYKTGQLFASPVVSFVSVLVTLFLYGGLMAEGNQCEEWMLPVFCFALYHTLQYALCQQATAKRSFADGLLMGVGVVLTVNIRPNDAVAILGGVIVGTVLIDLVNHNQAHLRRYALGLSAGLLAELPIIIYFASHHALQDYFYGMIGSNYANIGGAKLMFRALLERKKLALVPVFVALGVMVGNTEHRRLLLIICPCLTLMYLLMGRYMYDRYYIPLLPFLLLFFVFIIQQKNKSILLLSAAIILCGQVFNQTSLFKHARKKWMYQISAIHQQDEIRHLYAESERLINLIPADERDSVWNHNLSRDVLTEGQLASPDWTPMILVPAYYSVMWHSQLVPCNKTICFFGDNRAVYDDITQQRPLWVLRQQPSWFPSNGDDYVLIHYHLVSSTNTQPCQVELWRRND